MFDPAPWESSKLKGAGESYCEEDLPASTGCSGER